MSFEREISDEEIQEARDKRHDRALKLFFSATLREDRDQFLDKQFPVYLDLLNHMVENFDRVEFVHEKRKNYQESDSCLKGLLLKAFELAETLKLMEWERNRRNQHVSYIGGIAKCYEGPLKSATEVYKNNGGLTPDGEPKPPMAA